MRSEIEVRNVILRAALATCIRRNNILLSYAAFYLKIKMRNWSKKPKNAIVLISDFPISPLRFRLCSHRTSESGLTNNRGQNKVTNNLVTSDTINYFFVKYFCLFTSLTLCVTDNHLHVWLPISFAYFASSVCPINIGITQGFILAFDLIPLYIVPLGVLTYYHSFSYSLHANSKNHISVGFFTWALNLQLYLPTGNYN